MKKDALNERKYLLRQARCRQSNRLQKTLAAVCKVRSNILLICRDAIGLDYPRRNRKASLSILLEMRRCGSLWR